MANKKDEEIMALASELLYKLMPKEGNVPTSVSEENCILARKLRGYLKEETIMSKKDFPYLEKSKYLFLLSFLTGFIAGTWAKTTPDEAVEIRNEYEKRAVAF